MLDVGCLMLDVGCWMLDVRCSMFDVRCSMFDVGFSLHTSQREALSQNQRLPAAMPVSTSS
jgi:hypothetical protein